MKNWKKLSIGLLFIGILALIAPYVEAQNVNATTPYTNVGGQWKPQSDGYITTKTAGASGYNSLTTLVVATSGCIDWIDISSSDTIQQSLKLFDVKTTVGTSGVATTITNSSCAQTWYVASNSLSSLTTGGSGTVYSKSNTIHYDYSHSPIPFTNGVVMVSSDTAVLSYTFKWHKLGGK